MRQRYKIVAAFILLAATFFLLMCIIIQYVVNSNISPNLGVIDQILQAMAYITVDSAIYFILLLTMSMVGLILGVWGKNREMIYGFVMSLGFSVIAAFN